MPIYEYQAPRDGCEMCRQRFQRVQGIKDDPLTACPSCGGPVDRLLSSFSVGASDLSNSNLKSLGFTKLERRDKGVYENVTKP